MELTTWIAGLSAVAALISAAIAFRSSAASRRSAQMAERQTQLAYQELLGRWQPMIDFEVRSVSYRWSSGGMVWNEGERSDSGIDATERMTLKEAEANGLHAEVVVTGELIHHGSRQALLTAHDSDLSGGRLPLKNQKVFLVDGQATRNAVVIPGARTEVTWIDRRSVNEWREHYIAQVGRQESEDAELRPPRRSHGSSLTAFIRTLRDPLNGDRYLEWKATILRRSGFRLVIESRVEDRIPEVWEVQLGNSPLAPVDRDEKSQALRWRLSSDVDAPVDDDVVMYRCHRNTVLAQLDPPRHRHVPGRF